jgi:hypothetical protein
MLKTSLFSSKSNQIQSIVTLFVLLGIIAHVYLILFVYSAHFVTTERSSNQKQEFLSSSSLSLPTSPPTPNPHLFSSLGSGGDDDGDGAISITSIIWMEASSLDSKWAFNYFSIITIILLYISFTMKFTWPIGIEQTLIIVLLWMLFSNTFNTECYHCCDKGVVDDSNHSSQIHITDTSSDESVITTQHDTSSHHIIGKGGSGGGGGGGSSSMCFHRWQGFNVIYSLLCITSAILSYLSDIKYHFISKTFRFSSFVLMMIIVFMPMSCNQFGLKDINVLILKITLYNITWLMNRYMRFTESELESGYSDIIKILSKYDIVFTLREKGKKKKKKKKKKKRKESDDVESSEMEEDDEEEEEEGDVIEKVITEHDLEYLKISPEHLFKTLNEIGRRINQPDVVHFKTNNNLSGVDHYQRKKQQQQHTKKKKKLDHQLRTEKANTCHATSQLSLFQKLYKCSHTDYYKEFWCTRFISWKNRYYHESTNSLIDITRTIWILAICHSYLFFVGLVFLWLLYYIRANSKELQGVMLIRSVMRILHDKKVPFYTV